MNIVHLGTTIQTVFGVLDDHGNAIPQEPMTVQVQVFERDNFDKAFDAIRDARDAAIAKSDPMPKPAP